MALDGFSQMLNGMQQQGNQQQQLASFGNQQQMQQAQMAQEANSTQQQIATVQQQMLSENQKAEAQRHQIRMETANKIREMNNETYINRLKTSDKHTKSTMDTLKS